MIVAESIVEPNHFQKSAHDFSHRAGIFPTTRTIATTGFNPPPATTPKVMPTRQPPNPHAWPLGLLVSAATDSPIEPYPARLFGTIVPSNPQTPCRPHDRLCRMPFVARL